MSVGASGFSDSSFTVMYIPTIAMAFLWSNSDYSITELSVPLFGTEFTLDLLALFTIICLVGSIQHHSLAKAIFGPSGPAQNPKKSSIAMKAVLRIVLQTDQESSIAKQDERNKIRYVLDEFQLKNLPKMLSFFPMYFVQAAINVLLPVYTYLIFFRGLSNFVASILFLSLLTFKIRGLVSKNVPSPNYADSDLSVPEFEREEDPTPEYGS